MHAFATNLRFEDDEFNFVKTRAKVGTSEAFKRRDAHFRTRRSSVNPVDAYETIRYEVADRTRPGCDDHFGPPRTPQRGQPADVHEFRDAWHVVKNDDTVLGVVVTAGDRAFSRGPRHQESFGQPEAVPHHGRYLA